MRLHTHELLGLTCFISYSNFKDTYDVFNLKDRQLNSQTTSNLTNLLI